MAIERDVTYRSADGFQAKLDIYRSNRPGRRAAILYYHGGGWRGGSKEAMRPVAEAMTAYGYVSIPVQYRLLGDAPWPAQIEDVKASIQWVRAKATELDIDPNHIVLWGSSAGAQLALLAAGTPGVADGINAAVNAVIAVHPPVEFHLGDATSRHTTSAASLLGDNASKADARAASPITHVTEAFPPTLLLHGTYDRVVNHAASEAMMAALRSARAPCELHLFHGHNHGFTNIPSVRQQVAAEADFFLDRMLFNVDKYHAETLEHSMFARRAAKEADRQEA